MTGGRSVQDLGRYYCNYLFNLFTAKMTTDHFNYLGNDIDGLILFIKKIHFLTINQQRI